MIDAAFPIFAAGARGLQAADYLVVLVYILAVMGVGMYLSKQQKGSDDYFLAGRNMPWFAVGLSLIATLLSTISYLATPGELIKHGIAQSISHLVLPFSFAVTIFLWLPFFMKMRLTSVYEYLGLRYGSVARWVGVSLFVFVLRMLWMAVIVLTSAQAVAQITHKSATEALNINLSTDEWALAVLLAIGIFATVYTMLGGIKAVIWTDVLQFIALFLGAALTIGYIAYETDTGPVKWWNTATAGSTQHDESTPQVSEVPEGNVGGQPAEQKTAHKPPKFEGHDFPPLASWDLAERTTILWTCLSAFFWYICTYVSDQVAIQRFLTTPSVKAGILAGIANFFADISITILLVLCGMALLTYYLVFPDRLMDGVTSIVDADPDKIFPHFIEYGLPVGISGLVVAALFAVAMSSLDSGINSVSTVITVDMVRPRRPDMTSAQELRLARWMTLLVGLICTALAAGTMIYIPKDMTIIDITQRTFNCALGPLAVMFVAGMFMPHVGQGAIVIATFIGLVVALATAWWAELLWYLGMTNIELLEDAAKTVAHPSGYLVTPLAFTASFLVAAVLGALLKQPDFKKVQPLTWRGVVFGEGSKDEK